LHFSWAAILHIYNPALEEGWLAPRSGQFTPDDDAVPRLDDARGRY
jgi:hypothetical protein